MRLWHKDLMCVLPKDFLIQQFEDCRIIYEKLNRKPIGDLGEWTLHILSGSGDVEEYRPSIGNLISYWNVVYQEIDNRQYKDFVSKESLVLYHICVENFIKKVGELKYYNMIYAPWMGDRFKKQDLYELQRMYDLGQISEEDWIVITVIYPELK